LTRKASLHDLPQLAKLFDEYRQFYRKDSDLKAASQFLTDRITKGESEIFVHETEGELTGFTQLYPLFSSTRMKRLWLLNDLYIKPAFRGQHISKQLLDAAKELARSTNAAGVSLETEKSNQVGNMLYLATDFKLDKDHNFYFWTTS